MKKPLERWSVLSGLSGLGWPEGGHASARSSKITLSRPEYRMDDRLDSLPSQLVSATMEGVLVDLSTRVLLSQQLFGPVPGAPS